MNGSFRNFFDNFPFPLIEINTKTLEYSLEDLLVSINQAALKLYEAESFEAVIKKIDRIIPENSFKDLLRIKQAILNGEKNIEVETTHYTCLNHKKHLQIKVVPEFNLKNNDNVIFTLLDITGYKELISENELLARLPEINPDVVIIMRCDHSIKYVNPAGENLFGIKNESEYNKIHAFIPSLFDERICRNCVEDTLTQKEFHRNKKDFLMKIRPISSGRECMITLSDITDIKRLKRENELYSESLKCLDQAVIITDETGDIISVNKAFIELYGYSEEELQGKNTRVLNPGMDAYNNLGFSQADYNKLFSSLWKNISNPDIGKWEGTVINRTKAGRLLWVRLSISAIYSEDNQFYGYIALPIDETNSVDELNYSKIELYKTIADLSEMRDNETGNHMRRVGVFSKLLAKAYGMPEKYCNDIENFAPMHDIGKVGISDSILLAPRKLTNEEFKIMKTHTTFGYEIVKEKKDLEMAAEVTLHHHENFNGTGYPLGLKGDEIPLSARIVKIVDVYDALRSKRPYKDPWPHEEVVLEIQKNSGRQFDPILVEHFIELSEKFNNVYKELKD